MFVYNSERNLIKREIIHPVFKIKSCLQYSRSQSLFVACLNLTKPDPPVMEGPLCRRDPLRYDEYRLKLMIPNAGLFSTAL